MNWKRQFKSWLICKKSLGVLTASVALTLSSCYYYAKLAAPVNINLGDRTKFATFSQNKNISMDDNPYRIKNMITNVLSNTEASHKIVEQFAKELLYQVYHNEYKKNQSNAVGYAKKLVNGYKDAEKQTANSYQKVLDAAGGASSESGKTHFQQQVLDFNGGNISTYKHRKMANALYDHFLDTFSKFEIDEFGLNKNGSVDKLVATNTNDFLYNDSLLILTELNDTNNWEKIRFYPRIKRSETSSENKRIGINLINFKQFAYEQWLKTTKPFNVVMSLWKYDDKATVNNLKTIFDDKVLGGNFPSQSSYKFPYYKLQQHDNTQNTTVTKFQQFVTNLETLTPLKKAQPSFNIPTTYTDDSATSIYAEAQSIFTKLYPQFAAAAIHKFLQLTGGNDWSQRSQLAKDVNPISLNDLKKKDLIELFLEQKADTGNKSGNDQVGIPIDSSIFNQQSKYKEKNLVLDQRDLKNSPWIFLRNKAGVHAIAIDGYAFINGADLNKVSLDNQINPSEKTEARLKRAYQFFNFRTLQKIEADRLNIKDALQIKPFEAANEYFRKHFSSLLVDYFLQKSNQGLFENINPIKQILGTLSKFNQWNELNTHQSSNAETQFKNMLNQLVKIDYAADKLNNVFTVSEKTQSEYLDFQLKPSKKNDQKTYSAPENGLASVMPYKLSIDFTKDHNDSDNSGRYQALDAIYTDQVFDELSDLYSYSHNPSQSHANRAKRDVNKNSKKNNFYYHQEFQNNLNELTTTINLAADTNNNIPEYFNSSRAILTNSYFFDAVFDSYLESSKNNLNNLVGVNQLTKFYLSGLLDLNNNKVKADKSLSNDFKLDSNHLPLNDAIKDYYYGTTYKNSNNPLVYGGYKVTGNQTQKSGQNNDQVDESKLISLRTTYESIFDASFYYLSSKGFNIFSTENTDYLDFLRTLMYLVTNKFENLRLHLKAAITTNTKAGFAWITNIHQKAINGLANDQNVQEEFKKLRTNYRDRIFNPFVNIDCKFDQIEQSDNFNDSLSFAKTSNSFSTSSTNTFNDQYRGFSGLIIKDPQASWNNPNDSDKIQNALANLKNYTNQQKNGLLFSFNNTDELAKYIKNFDSVQDVNNLLTELKNLIPTLDPTPITTQSVIITMDDKDSSKNIVRPLNFKEKQNALLALIYNYKMPENSGTPISKTQFKKIYGTDPDRNFEEVSTSFTKKLTGDDYHNNIDDNLYTRFTGFLSSDNNTAITTNKYSFRVNDDTYQLANVIQFNQNDLKDQNSFISFIKNYLGSSTFADWLVKLATEDFFKTQSKNDFEQKLDKLTLHDIRFQKNLDQKYVNRG